MKLDCPRKELFEAISAATAASSIRSSNVILQSLKIEASEAEIRVVGCDGEMWVERKIAAISTEPGSTALPAKTLQQIVGSLGAGDVHITTLDGGAALLTQGASEYRLQAYEPDDFPEPPSLTADGELKLKMGQLRKGIDSVIYAVSNDEHRQILRGVLLSYNGNTLTFVATDTHRLAVRRISLEGSGTPATMTVPARALKAIAAMPITDDEEVTLHYGGNQLAVSSGGARVVSNLLTGTYPNWERVVPSESTRSWTVESDQFLEKVKRVLIIVNDSVFRIKFKGADEQILIQGHSDERGDAKEWVPMIGNNGDIEIAFNGKYVQDAIENLDGPGVLVQLTENTRPAIFRSPDDDEAFCVIMPMHVN